MISDLDRIYLGDCIETMKKWPDACVDAVVTDPPYGIRFMGKAWDGADIDKTAKTKTRKGTPMTGAKAGSRTHEGRAFAAGSYDLAPEAMLNFQVWTAAWAAEALRVLKPGGHLLAFASTRTYHRMASGVEDAGFEIRDMVPWLFGSGFPKSLDVSKAIDRAEGVKREDKFEGSFDRFAGPTGNKKCDKCGKWMVSGSPCKCPRPQDKAVSAAAKQWAGWGTALKPACEPVVLARKPLSEKTVASNVKKWGTGALNIDASRIGFSSEADEAESKGKNQHADLGTKPGGNKVYGDYSMVPRENYNPVGRWPANLIVMHHRLCVETADGHACVAECPMRILDAQAGALTPGNRPEHRNTGFWADKPPLDFDGEGMGGGGAARFFYCAKPSTAERERGTEERERGALAQGNQAQAEVKRGNTEHAGKSGMNTVKMRGNIHPTVKPVDLMAYLIRLVTPPGGVVLDPFLGSGTTAIAAAREGFKWIGVEMSAEYVDIAQKRIAAETAQGKLL